MKSEATEPTEEHGQDRERPWRQRRSVRCRRDGDLPEGDRGQVEGYPHKDDEVGRATVTPQLRGQVWNVDFFVTYRPVTLP